MNRRDPAGPADTALRVLLLDGEEGPVASLLDFACHATVLSGANTPALRGVPRRRLPHRRSRHRRPGGLPQGACGDVNPLWVRQDFASVERAGQAVGGAAVRLIADLRAAGDGLRAHNIRWDEFPEAVAPGRLAEPLLRIARREIDLPLRGFLADEAYAARVEAAQGEADRYPVSSPARREAMAQLSRFSAERWSGAWSRRTGESGTYRTELQAISIAEGVAVLGLPGEFFAETGAQIRQDSGIEQLLIACYANDYAGYIVPEHAYEEGGYESGVTFFTGEAEAMIRTSSLELLREVSGDD